jgi:hypothetical protein
MATTIVPIAGSATPYSKKFLLTGDGTEGLFNLADFATHLVEGPLKRTLLGAASTAIAAFNVDGVRGEEIRIYNLAATAADVLAPRAGAYTIRWVANANPALAGLSCTLANLDVRAIEIRLNHSTQA